MRCRSFARSHPHAWFLVLATVALATSPLGCAHSRPAPSTLVATGGHGTAPDFREWTPEAFAEARSTRKLLLISVQAGWCHWCHVMNAETFADPRVLAVLAQRYVVIRVEADARPDIAERYAEYGWPATALLTPDAEPILALHKGFDDPKLFSAWLHTLRWSCVTSTRPELFQAPWRAGIEVKAYQLEPLRKALRLPRVNLFIADDVGLGKTIEAGLIVRELLMRQKVRRVVICAPPSVVVQWREEMESRFGLGFVVLDREYVASCGCCC